MNLALCQSLKGRHYGLVGGWHHSRETARQLTALTDRELSDIGLSQGDIYQAARQGQ
ncbi:DUF1127 domain-containing protein [Microvirga sp. Marseille-Q2068]|uniref:DUF1127 domain-containing protein n=1 Tax=Microvirga mediterraneensis TaxID=2754695 RepID=A0A838BVG2_9HYPH|nr:DUF1127 domain-containing protein [Microvirga mediterraneensis]